MNRHATYIQRHMERGRDNEVFCVCVCVRVCVCVCGVKIPSASCDCFFADTNLFVTIDQKARYNEKENSNKQKNSSTQKSFLFQITAQCAPIELERVDKQASNGLIHVLQGVMIPPAGNAVVSLAACPKFQTLVKLVKLAGLTQTLAGGDHFTIFAPTNDAIAKVPQALLDKLLKDKKLLTSTAD